MSDQAASSHVRVRRSSRRIAYMDAALPADLADALWTRPEELIARGERLRHNGRRTTVHLAWESRQFVLKHYVENSRRHALKRLVQPSRAWLAWKTSHRLADAGILTPRPLACVENRWLGLGGDSFVVYSYVEGVTLRSHFDGQLASTAASRDGLWREYCKLWDRLAEQLITLGDGNLGNFIVAPDRRLWVIDVDKTRFHRLRWAADWHRRQRWKRVIRCFARCERQRQRRLAAMQRAVA